jgi:hypothetical protein
LKITFIFDVTSCSMVDTDVSVERLKDICLSISRFRFICATFPLQYGYCACYLCSSCGCSLIISFVTYASLVVGSYTLQEKLCCQLVLIKQSPFALLVVPMVKRFFSVMEPERSLLCAQEFRS